MGSKQAEEIVSQFSRADIILEYQAKYGNTDLRGGAREQDIMSSGSGSDSDPA